MPPPPTHPLALQGLETDPLTGHILARPPSSEWARWASEQENWAAQVGTWAGSRLPPACCNSIHAASRFAVPGCFAVAGTRPSSSCPRPWLARLHTTQQHACPPRL